MDLWTSSKKWAPADAVAVVSGEPVERIDADAVHADDHDHEPLTLAATLVMWFTVLLPYVGLVALMTWTVAFAHDWVSLVVFVVSYLAIGFGVTIGYHRLLAHRAFSTYRWVEATFLILGCMAMQGPPVRWAATHRRHHQRSDHDGDPHSPHLAGNGVRGVLLGLWHAHTGWLLTPDKPNTERSIKDLLNDPMIRFVDHFYWLWLVLSVLIPFGVGMGIYHTVTAGLACVFWAVVVRISLMHHATWSVNSICHFFGYQSYHSNDHSRNNPIIAVLSLGEGWHNNHHAFPTSARHGLRWFEVDLSYIVIRTLELTRLIWNVRRPSESALNAKAVGG